jgi:RNA recognition motif-containing protein
MYYLYIYISIIYLTIYLFSIYLSTGKVNNVTMLRDRHTGKHKGFSYVEMSHLDDVPNCLLFNNVVPGIYLSIYSNIFIMLFLVLVVYISMYLSIYSYLYLYIYLYISMYLSIKYLNNVVYLCIYVSDFQKYEIMVKVSEAEKNTTKTDRIITGIYLSNYLSI